MDDSNKETTKSVQLKILEVKALNHYLVKEVDSEAAKHYQTMEDMLQKTYSIADNCVPKEDFDSGSSVCVYVNPEAIKRRKAPKKWVRGVVRKMLVWSSTYLVEVYLIDYGIKLLVKRSDVRELRTHFSTEFVKIQTKNFHLSEIQLKPDVNTENNILIVKDLLFKSNKSLILANITKETDTNLLGIIKLNDGLDLNQFLVEKSWATNVYENEVRKPRTSPLFKNVSRLSNGQNESSVQSFKDKAVNDDSNSLSSVSSTNISMSSDGSNIPEVVINSSEEEDNHKDSEQLNALKSGRFDKLFTRIKLMKERQQMMASNGETLASSSDRSESPIDYVIQYNSKDYEEVDWPEPQRDGRKVSIPLRPAGFADTNPQQNVGQRIYTLKK